MSLRHERRSAWCSGTNRAARTTHSAARQAPRDTPGIDSKTGGAVGTELALDGECVTLGRGPSVDLAFDDPAMSRQHAAVEYVDEQFRVRDLGSTNGVLLNGEPVQVGEINDGDRMAIGGHEFQLVVEVRETEPETYELPSV